MQVTDIAVSQPAPTSRALTVLLVFLFLGLMMWVAVAEGGLKPPCERHAGAFSSDFLADYDIDRIDCRILSMKRSPTVHFWPSAPYVGLDWGKVYFWASPPFVWLDRGRLTAAQ
jgi:hypothetical protein